MRLAAALETRTVLLTSASATSQKPRISSPAASPIARPISRGEPATTTSRYRVMQIPPLLPVRVYHPPSACSRCDRCCEKPPLPGLQFRPRRDILQTANFRHNVLIETAMPIVHKLAPIVFAAALGVV